jgi:hypothetical protein
VDGVLFFTVVPPFFAVERLGDELANTFLALEERYQNPYFSV